MEIPQSEEDQPPASARVRGNRVCVTARTRGLRRRRSGSTARNQRSSSQHRPVNNPPAADNDAANHDSSISAEDNANALEGRRA